MDVLFVGPVSGYSSYPVVCKGLLRALTEAGIRPIVADVTWDGSENHTDSCFDNLGESRIIFLDHQASVDLVRRGVAPSAYNCKACIAVNPAFSLFGIKQSGIKVFGLFVGDVDVVPGSWQQLMNMCDVVMTPSSWCRDAIVSSDVSSRVVVLNHGITNVFVPMLDSEERSGSPEDVFVFLHMCSAVFYPERKGTPQFLEAAQRLAKDTKNVVFRAIFGMNTRAIKALMANLGPDIKERVQVYFFSGARPQSEIIRIYNGCHAAVFPSRAEGFGCIPLEVRACGIPVVQTLCTGHRDHIEYNDDPARWGIVEIPHGPLSDAWGGFGRAPSVSPDNVYESMKKCLSEYGRLRKAALEMADAVRSQWAWSETTRPLIDLIQKECV